MPIGPKPNINTLSNFYLLSTKTCTAGRLVKTDKSSLKLDEFLQDF